MNDNPLLDMILGGGGGGAADPMAAEAGMGGMGDGSPMPDDMAEVGMPSDMGGGGMIQVPVALFQELMARAYPDTAAQQIPAAPEAPQEGELGGDEGGGNPFGG